MQTHAGVKGLVVDAETGETVEGAVVWVKNMTDNAPIKHPVTTGTSLFGLL